MDPSQKSSDDSLESDAVWSLLESAPVKPVRSSFADDVVRKARLIETNEKISWWSCLQRNSMPLGLAGAAAAIGLMVFLSSNENNVSREASARFDSPDAVAIQDIAELETLIAAADQLDDFSDTELVSLIGF